MNDKEYEKKLKEVCSFLETFASEAKKANFNILIARLETDGPHDRNKVIDFIDVGNLVLALHTTKDVLDFIKVMELL